MDALFRLSARPGIPHDPRAPTSGLHGHPDWQVTMRNLEPISPTHLANPITPLMMAAQEESRAAAAEAATADAPSAGEEAGPVEAVEAPEAAAAPAPSTSTASRSGFEERAPAFVRCQIGSLLLLLLGVGLGVAPSFSPAAAQWLESAGRLHLQAGTLIVAGLLLFTVTVVWRALWGIRSTLEAVGSETARIEQIALDGQTLRESLDMVRRANSTLTHDVTNLQVQVKRLTDIVSNPDYTVSIFRLAASVDQLGKHIELHMKEQFDGMQKHSAAIADQSGHVQSQLVARLDQVQALTKDQYRTQYNAVQEGVAQLLAASEQTNTRIEKSLDAGTRIEARLQDQQDSLSVGLDCVLDRFNQGTTQLSAAVEALGGRVDRQLDGHAASWHARLSGIDGRIEAAQREHAAELQDLGGRLGSAFDGHVEELKQKLRTVTELSNANRQELANHLDVLGARLEDHARNQLASVERAREHALENARTIQRDVAASLAQLETQLGETAREHAAVLRKSSHESQQAAGATRRELAARLEQLGLDLERQGREQQALLQKAAQEVQQASGTARRELATKIEALGSDLERRTRDQLDVLSRATQEAKAATGAAKNELAGSVEQLGSRLEAKLDSRSNDLASDLIELAEMLSVIRTDLRTTLVEAVRACTEPASIPTESPSSATETSQAPEVDVIDPPTPASLLESTIPDSPPEPHLDLPALLDIGAMADPAPEAPNGIDTWARFATEYKDEGTPAVEETQDERGEPPQP